KLPKLKRKKKLYYANSSDEEDADAATAATTTATTTTAAANATTAALPAQPKKSFSFYSCPVCGKKIKSERRFTFHTNMHKRLMNHLKGLPPVDSSSSSSDAVAHASDHTSTLETVDQANAAVVEEEDADLTKTLGDINQVMEALQDAF
ncbi:hypothetical protein MBANPS3_002146, partial [Mucor bainieri]